MGMKAKNIRIVIRKKLREWWKSIKDEEVRKLAEENTIVTGGAIASMLLGEEVKDFDVYFRTQDAAHRVASYYVDLFKEDNTDKFNIRIEVLEDRVSVIVKSAGIATEKDGTNDYQYFETTNPEDNEAEEYLQSVVDVDVDASDDEEEGKQKKKYRPKFMTTNAITLSDKIQIVTRFFGEPQNIHENYDFVHCTSYYTSWNGQLEIPKEALLSLMSKELRYVGSKYPICSILRLRKFIDRGWYITAGQVMKMCWQAAELDLSDFEVLKEQMTGVDFAYFQEIIEALSKRDEKRVDGAYLFELLDRIF